MLNVANQALVEKLKKKSESLPASRQKVLSVLLNRLRVEKEQQMLVNLVFICTHNSRRSHIAQLLATILVEHFQIKNIHCHSGGTETTALNERVVQAFETMQIYLKAADSSENPVYQVEIAKGQDVINMSSKLFSDESIPKENLFAVMTCSDAEENCPFVPGSVFRHPLTYQDPKSFDDTPQESQAYTNKIMEIGSELYWLFEQYAISG